MNFDELKTSAMAFSQQVEGATHRPLIDNVSLEEPRPPPDELHFVRLVAWSYVFIVEAGHQVFRFLTPLLRQQSPQRAEENAQIRELLIAHRTVLTHNLNEGRTSDETKRRKVQIWFLEVGQKRDWNDCCARLSADVGRYISTMADVLSASLTDPEDRDNFISELLTAIECKWEGHEFDRLLEAAASLVEISDFDIVAYRNHRLKDWRSITTFFHTRDAAQKALMTVMLNELRILYKPTAIIS